MREIESDRIGRILVRGTNWIGDAVMSVPAMRHVRALFPRARISLLVRPWVRDVYSAVDFVDEVLDYDSRERHRGWSGRERMIHELKRREFDLALLLQNAFEAAYLAWRAKIPTRIGYARDCRGFLLTHACRIDPELRNLHQVYYYLGILAAASLLPAQPWAAGVSIDIGIGVRESDRAAASRLLAAAGVDNSETTVGINPGASYGSAKRWLLGRYAEVADALASRFGVRIIIFGSASERPFAEAIAGSMRQRPAIVAGATTLGQLMALIARCALLITNDSGPMHLAAALDTPQLAIFGSTSEVATGPLNSRAEVIREPVECSPCFKRECPIDLRCMTAITVERVLAAAERKLGAILAGRR